MVEIRSGSSSVFVILTGRDRDDRILAILAVKVLGAQDHPVFFHAEHGDAADRQDHGMLVILGANVEDHTVGAQSVFLAQQGVGFLVRRIGAEHFAGQALAVFFVITALDGIHLHQHAALVGLGV